LSLSFLPEWEKDVPLYIVKMPVQVEVSGSNRSELVILPAGATTFTLGESVRVVRMYLFWPGFWTFGTEYVSRGC
jgi:hypothetical protein